jgi:nucleoside-diphosphate-sugar epimerase
MSVLVTGGTGFLGRRIVERLLGQGRAVSVLARNPAPDLEARGVRVICAAIDNAEAVHRACAGMETVFHVAAKVGVWGDYESYYDANVLGTRAVLYGCRSHDVKKLIYTSTPSVVYNGRDLTNADESLPLTTACPSPYPLTKALAEAEVLAANSPKLRTLALRPHLIWGPGDPHLVPRVLKRARAGRLRIVGSGQNLVDMVYIENAVDAHLLADAALNDETAAPRDPDRHASGRAYFITNGEPVKLWEWINSLLLALGEPPVKKRVSLRVARTLGSVCETFWGALQIEREPPMTRFVAAELAKDHYFDLTAARRHLHYEPRVSMNEGTAKLVASLKALS